MDKNFIYTRSLNCAAYLLYFNKQPIEFYVDNKTDKILFKFKNNYINRQLYDSYKENIHNQGNVFLDIVKYNKIIKKLKNASREFKKDIYLEVK